ncbi:unnamed protein product [Eretmochelys imbricata]
MSPAPSMWGSTAPAPSLPGGISPPPPLGARDKRPPEVLVAARQGAVWARSSPRGPARRTPPPPVPPSAPPPPTPSIPGLAAAAQSRAGPTRQRDPPPAPSRRLPAWPSASSSAAAPPRPPFSGLRRRPRPLRQLGDREEPAGRGPRDRAGLTQAAPPPPGPACRIVPWSVFLTFANVSALGQHGQRPPVVFKTLFFCFWFPFSLPKKLAKGSAFHLILRSRAWAGFPTPS